MSRRNRRPRRRKPARIVRVTPPGSVPGTVKAPPDAKPTTIELIAYDAAHVDEKSIGAASDLAKLSVDSNVRWINVVGLADTAALKTLGEVFELHPLAMEDVVNVHQRAKAESYGDHLFIVARSETVTSEDQASSEQLSLFLGRGFVLTFQQWAGDCFGPIRKRLRAKGTRIRTKHADYLAYALLDAIIDSYFPVVEQYAERLDELEEDITNQRAGDAMARAHEIRTELSAIRRNLRAHRDVAHELIHNDHQLVSDETRMFLRDCYDHTVQLLEFVDMYQETCTSLRDYYLSMTNSRLNEVMKVLTIIATTFIPLSFITGLYGMNFNPDLPGNMPELNRPYGYVAALAVMACLASVMIFYFWRRGWLRS